MALLEQSKSHLRSVGALVINEDGDEVLIGLTNAESNFLFSQRLDFGADADLGERRLRVQLRNIHLTARSQKIGLELGGATGLTAHRQYSDPEAE